MLSPQTIESCLLGYNNIYESIHTSPTIFRPPGMGRTEGNIDRYYEEPVHSDYMDLGLVDIPISNRATIKMMLKLTDTTKDKLTYTLHTLNLLFCCMLVTCVPQYFYIWHTSVTITLVGYRITSYRKLRQQFFLFDFCYFSNAMVLLYLWLPEAVLGAELRGRLFTVCFALAIGPVLLATIVWRASLVPHSNDKMTSLFIHFSPALSLLGIRWYSTPEQGFPLCYRHSSEGRSACSDLPLTETLFYPMAAYLVWQAFYIIVVDILCWKKVLRGNYSTSYLTFIGNNGKLFNLFSLLGPSLRKPMFVAWQVIYTTVLLNLTYYCYFSKAVNIAMVSAALAYSCYNGASFYIDVFSYKYRMAHPRKYKMDG